MKISKQKGRGGLIGLIVVGLIIWGVIYLFSGSNKGDDYDSGRTNVFSGYKDCSSLVPSNPYSGGSGHYAGFEWGERGNTCGGNSSSFIEGCEEYENQEEVYNNCLSR